MPKITLANKFKRAVKERANPKFSLKVDRQFLAIPFRLGVNDMICFGVPKGYVVVRMTLVGDVEGVDDTNYYTVGINAELTADIKERSVYIEFVNYDSDGLAWASSTTTDDGTQVVGVMITTTGSPGAGDVCLMVEMVKVNDTTWPAYEEVS